jgi:hypothetical protein
MAIPNPEIRNPMLLFERRHCWSMPYGKKKLSVCDRGTTRSRIFKGAKGRLKRPAWITPIARKGVP